MYIFIIVSQRDFTDGQFSIDICLSLDSTHCSISSPFSGPFSPCILTLGHHQDLPSFCDLLKSFPLKTLALVPF